MFEFESIELVSYSSKEAIAISTALLEPEVLLRQSHFEIGQVDALLPQ